MNFNNPYLPGTIAIPSMLLIVGITNAFPMVITYEVPEVTGSFSYIAGQLVKLIVPFPYQMTQANGLVGQILSIDTDNNEIELNIDSTLFDTFVIPSGNVEQPASLSPAGSRNLEFNNLTNKVPFQSLNNVGN